MSHEVLNAKNHYREAQIIMNAGQRGAILLSLLSIWPDGTDIKLGEGKSATRVDYVKESWTERRQSRLDRQPASWTFRVVKGIQVNLTSTSVSLKMN